MRSLISVTALLAVALSSAADAQKLSMLWGLENTWSYRETKRSLDEDGAVRSKKPQKEYRAFAFSNDKSVVDPMLQCFDRHFKLWDQYRKTLGGGQPTKAGFEKFKSGEDPACDQHAKRQAPVLYFDFVSSPKDQFILEAIEITTLRFSEYRGGGFFKEEAWYDLLLSHKVGKKRYDVSKRLVFTGTGRAELRLWSDNYYAGHGWIAPMGEYLIDIKFIFSSDGREITVSTGPFKIDV